MADIQLIDSSAFLCLDPSRWWDYKNTATGGTAHIACSSPLAEQVLVKVTIGAKVTEHYLAIRPPDAPGCEKQYVWLYSIYEGKRYTWGDGLVIPCRWKVGDSVTAISREGNPLTGNPVRITLTLTNYGKSSPPAGTSFPPGTTFEAAEIHHVVVDAGLGTKWIDAKSSFAMGLGPYAIDGITYGVPFVLRIQKCGVDPA